MILITCESAMSVKTRHILPGTFQPSTEDLFTVIVSVLCESLGCDPGIVLRCKQQFFFCCQSTEKLWNSIAAHKRFNSSRQLFSRCDSLLMGWQRKRKCSVISLLCGVPNPSISKSNFNHVTRVKMLHKWLKRNVGHWAVDLETNADSWQ